MKHKENPDMELTPCAMSGMINVASPTREGKTNHPVNGTGIMG